MTELKVVFFDLGDTLGTPRFNATGVLEAFDLFPLAAEALAKMKLQARLGVISNTPAEATLTSMSAVMAAAGILTIFDPALLCSAR